MTPGARTPAWGALIAAARRGEAPLVRLGATPRSVGATAAGLVYLATPYSKEVVDGQGAWSLRASQMQACIAAREAARLARHGVTALSPIVLSAEMCHVEPGLDPLDDAFWHRWCAPILAAARAVVVPDIAGWDRSRGIWREVCDALARNLPIHVYAGG